jgi:putative tricarboxylic transport membrane protein
MTLSRNLPAVVTLSYGGFGLVVAGVGAGLIWEARGFESSISYSSAGPEVFPYLVGGGLVVLGLLVLLDVVRRIKPAEYCFELEWKPVVWILAGLIVHLLVIGPLGWIVGSTLLFMFGARGFGSKRIFADLMIGLVLSIGTVVLFQNVLGLRLPAGPFASLF